MEFYCIVLALFANAYADQPNITIFSCEQVVSFICKRLSQIIVLKIFRIMLGNLLPLLSISLLNQGVSREKINTVKTSQPQAEPTANIAIIMADSTLPLINQIHSMEFETVDDKRIVFFETLSQFTAQSQAPVLEILNFFQPFVTVEPRWLENVIYVDNASFPLLQTLSTLPLGISSIREQVKNMKIIKPINVQAQAAAPTLNSPAWGISKINSPTMWTAGNGTGVVVASKLSQTLKFTLGCLESQLIWC